MRDGIHLNPNFFHQNALNLHEMIFQRIFVLECLLIILLNSFSYHVDMVLCVQNFVDCLTVGKIICVIHFFILLCVSEHLNACACVCMWLFLYVCECVCVVFVLCVCSVCEFVCMCACACLFACFHV